LLFERTTEKRTITPNQINTNPLHFLKSAPMPAAKPARVGPATPMASVGTKTVLLPNAATREIS
jgi:hypothetical protein